MRHTDPPFRALLLALAESDPPDLGTALVLADLLEERGDPRAAAVRGPQPVQVAWAEPARVPVIDIDREIIRCVLALFPEGPRWAVRKEDERYESSYTPGPDCIGPTWPNEFFRTVFQGPWPAPSI